MGRIKEDPKDQGILKRISKGFRSVQNSEAVLLKRMRIFEIIKSLESTVHFSPQRRQERMLEITPLIENFLYREAGSLAGRSMAPADIPEDQIQIFEEGRRVKDLLAEYSRDDLESAERLRVLNRLSEGLHRLFKLKDKFEKEKKEGKTLPSSHPETP